MAHSAIERAVVIGTGPGKEPVIPRRTTKWYEANPDKAFWLFVIFASLVFLMGGGSRYDIVSVGPLRFISALVLAVAVWWQTKESFQKIAVPVYLLLALAAWMVVQLIPLPPSWWHTLPGRETIAELDSVLGLGEVWRPITLSPLRTLNSLGSLVVPLAAVLLLALLDENGWQRVRKFVVIVGVISALLGIAQITMRGASGLYLYEITNRGSAVGLFSNRNHNALFLNLALLFSFFKLETAKGSHWNADRLFQIAGQVILILAILINGSRFGLVMLALVGAMYAAQALMLARGRAYKSRSSKYAGILVGLLSVALISLFAFLDRIPAIQRFFERSVSEDLRGQSLPYVVELMKGYFPLGAGFGSFEQAYRAIEPVDLLGPSYLNQAHNDWLQLVIEGGLVGVLLLSLSLGVLAWKCLTVLRVANRGKAERELQWLGVFAIALFAMHSVVDYPLRTPSLMVIAMIAVSLVLLPAAQEDNAMLRRGR